MARLPTETSGAQPVLSPDGRYLLVTVIGGGLTRLDVQRGTTQELPGNGIEDQVVAITPDGRFFAVGRADGSVDLYDARSLRIVRRHQLDSGVKAMAFSPDSRSLAVESNSNVLKVWDTCDICENAPALARLAAQKSVRTLTPGEVAAYGSG